MYMCFNDCNVLPSPFRPSVLPLVLNTASPDCPSLANVCLEGRSPSRDVGRCTGEGWEWDGPGRATLANVTCVHAVLFL